MSTYQLSVIPRESRRGTKQLLKEGRIPGIVYGPGFHPTAISISAKEFAKVLHEAGTSQIINLSLPDSDSAQREKKSSQTSPHEPRASLGLIRGSSLPTLMHELQRDPITGRITHVDFYHVTKGHKVSAMIPLVFVGISPGIKDKGGTLVTHLREVEVEGLPEKLPASLDVDISGLKEFGDEIVLGDLSISPDVTLLGEVKTSVVSLLAPQVEEKKEEVLTEEAQTQEAEGLKEEVT